MVLPRGFYSFFIFGRFDFIVLPLIFFLRVGFELPAAVLKQIAFYVAPPLKKSVLPVAVLKQNTCFYKKWLWLESRAHFFLSKKWLTPGREHHFSKSVHQTHTRSNFRFWSKTGPPDSKSSSRLGCGAFFDFFFGRLERGCHFSFFATPLRRECHFRNFRVAVFWFFEFIFFSKNRFGQKT